MRNPALIDVNILHLPEREEWLQECLRSMDGQPVKIHVLPSVDPEAFFAALKIAYSNGDAEYVCHVDDDDWVAPGVFTEILNAFDRYPESDWVQTPMVIVENGREIPRGVMTDMPEKVRPCDTRYPILPHLTVYRRSAVARYTQNPNRGISNTDYDLHLQRGVRENGWGVYLKTIGYYWRLHDHQLHRRKISA